MANILDYLLWRGDLSFTQSELNEVDSLLFAELSYLNFSGIAQGEEGIFLSDAAESYFRNGRAIQQNNGDLYKKEYPEMLRRMAESARFGKVRAANYIQKNDPERNMQFAAMTFEISSKEVYVAFRGTDDTLLGWKEDFLMSVLETVPSQEEALLYLKQVAERYPRRKLYIGGHSKGGNLAVYAATEAGSRLQNRMIQIFNHDGPGFKQTRLDTKNYQAIREKIHTTVPQSSLVGMLLEHDNRYTVIKSNERGARQHDGLSWEVCGARFVRAQGMTRQSRLTNETIRNVLGRMTDEQRRQFTEAVFGLLESEKNKTLTDIRLEGWKNVSAMIRTYDGLDPTVRRVLHKILLRMVQEGLYSVRREVRKGTSEITQS